MVPVMTYNWDETGLMEQEEPVMNNNSEKKAYRASGICLCVLCACPAPAPTGAPCPGLRSPNALGVFGTFLRMNPPSRALDRAPVLGHVPCPALFRVPWNDF